MTNNLIQLTFNILMQGMEQNIPTNLAMIAQQFNDCDGRGVHGIFSKKVYEPFAKFVPGKRGYSGVEAPELIKINYTTITFGNQEGTSWETRNEAHGNNISGATKEAWQRPVSLEELADLGIQNPKFGRFYCNKKVEKVESLDQLYVQYYLVKPDCVGYVNQNKYWSNKVVIEKEDINWEMYKTSSSRDGEDISYVLQKLSNFMLVVK